MPYRNKKITATENSIGASEANVSNVSYINNGNEAVKLLEFYICAWDDNGYPLKLNFGYDNYTLCEIEQPNTLKGATDKYTWTTYSADNKKVKEYKAVVSKVELYDGTTWVNNKAEDEISEIASKTIK